MKSNKLCIIVLTNLKGTRKPKLNLALIAICVKVRTWDTTREVLNLSVKTDLENDNTPRNRVQSSIETSLHQCECTLCE